MKKIIPSFILTSLVSSSFLLAQNNNRLKATNQVTGERLNDRLEAVGYRLEARKTDRDSLVDVTTSNELRTANCANSASSLNCHLIGQRVETTTNNELPTTNCANSAGSLNCHLMMDPTELKPVEEGIENLRGVFGLSGESSSSSQSAVNAVAAPHSSAESSSSSVAIAESRKRAYEENSANMNDAEGALLGKEGWGDHLPDTTIWELKSKEVQEKESLIQAKVHEAQEMGKIELATGYREAASILTKVINLCQLSAEAKAAGNMEESNHWDCVASSFQQQAEHQIKASEAQEIGKVKLAEGYREAVAILAIAMKYHQQVALFYVNVEEGREEEGSLLLDEKQRYNWNSAAQLLQSKANYWVKASETQEIGKIELAASYREAASILEKAAIQWEKAAQAFAAKKPDQAISYQKEGKFLQAQADYQVKASEAQEVGKAKLATGYRETAAILNIAVEYDRKAALSYDNMKKHHLLSGEKQGYSWNSAAQSLESQANYWVKAYEAEEEGKTVLAVAYREAATISQEAADYGQRAAENFTVKDNGGGGWYWKSKSLQVVADYQVKAAETQAVGKIQLAAAYREVAEISERASNYWELAASSFDEGREDEAISWQNEATSLQAEADYQVNRAIQEELFNR